MISDISIFSLYIFILLYLGWKSQRKNPTQDEFLLSNRSLSLPALVATLVTTWYGGILGIGEFIYLKGVSAWIIFGVPYYFFALLFALYLAPRIRASRYVSIPDLLYQNYGKAPGLLGSFFILFITSPAPYILITGILVSFMLGISLTIAIILSALFSIIYIFKGGFRSVVQTDKFQFILMFGGFAVLMGYLFIDYGSPLQIFNNLPQDHQSFSGGMSLQHIIVWFLIASWTFIDPGFHQRTAAAKDAKTAKKAILVSILFWFVFDMLTLWTGIYATVLISNADPLMIYPLIAEQVLPPVLKSIFLIALLATAMSTVDSFAFLSAQTFGRDIIAYWNKKDSDSEVAHYTQLGLALTAALALILIGLVPSVVSLWYNLGSLFIPPLMIPILAAIFPQLNVGRKYIMLLMLAGFSTSLIWFLFGIFNEGNYPLGLEPFLPGLLITFIIYFYSKYNQPRS